MNLRLFPFLQVFTAMPVVCFRGKRYLEWKRHQTTGSLKCTHHFGRKRFFIFGEQLILHELVTHSINLSLPPLASVLGAAAFAAGDRLLGTICFGSQNPPTPLTLARHCSMVTKPQFVPPPRCQWHTTCWDRPRRYRPTVMRLSAGSSSRTTISWANL